MDITTVAKLAGVSRYRIALLNDGYVSDEKRRAIARVIKETGYILPTSKDPPYRKDESHWVIIPKINRHRYPVWSALLGVQRIPVSDAFGKYR